MKRRDLRNCRSQALIELALASTMILLIMVAATDLGTSIYRTQVIASAVREGAKAASTASDEDDSRIRGLTAAQLVCDHGLGSNNFYTNGGIILTALIKYSTSQVFFNVETNSAGQKLFYSYGQFGLGNTNGILEFSKLLNKPSETTNSLTRTGTAIPAGLAVSSPANKKIYCVEVMWTNRSRGILSILPTNLYDKAFFVYP